MILTEKWYAVETHPRYEKKVSYLLTQQGYECFFPTYKKRKKWLHKAVEFTLPLFPGYIFIRIKKKIMTKVVFTRGVKKIVSFGATPIDIPENEIRALQSLDQSSLLRKPWEYIPNGTLIAIKSGPLAGLEGILNKETKCNNKKGNKPREMIISVSLLQRSVLVQLDDGTAISVVRKIENRKQMKNRKNKNEHSESSITQHTNIILKLLE